MLSAEVRAALEDLKPGEHSHGLGVCRACGGFQLRLCGTCEKRSLHRIGAGRELELVCENGCTAREASGREVRFRAEMAEALYQLDQRDASARRGRRAGKAAAR